jgi:hypothetical protein
MLLVAVVCALLVAGDPARTVAHAVSVDYRPPVPGTVLQGFDPPGSPYGAGHRGVDLAATPGEVVRAAADGVVVHAGPVAGRVWVSLDHADGVRTAYGPLAQVTVDSRERVRGGQRLGALASGGHGHGGRDDGLHLSARRDGTYIDPLALLASRGRPSLVGAGQAADLHPRGGDRAVPSTGAVSAPPASGQPPAHEAEPAVRARRAAPGPPAPAPTAPAPSPVARPG